MAPEDTIDVGVVQWEQPPASTNLVSSAWTPLGLALICLQVGLWVGQSRV